MKFKSYYGALVNSQSQRMINFVCVPLSTPCILNTLGLKELDLEEEIITTENYTLNDLILTKIVQYNGNGSYVYGIPGAASFQIDLTLQNNDEPPIGSGSINYIHIANESSGAYQGGYRGFILQNTGILFTTAGPGVVQALPGLINNFFEKKPLICFHGSPGDITNFQYINPLLTGTITSQSYIITKDTINPQIILDNAFYIAQNGTTENPGAGPVSIFVEEDAWLSKVKTSNKPPSLYQKSINYSEIYNLINKIMPNITSQTYIIIRIGPRVNNQVFLMLANLSNTYKNISIHLNTAFNNYLNPYTYPNVWSEGMVGNTCANYQYSKVNIVIDIGPGHEYAGVDFINPELLPYINNNIKFYFVFNEKLNYESPLSNSTNSIITDVEVFTNLFIIAINNTLKNPTVNWDVNVQKFLQTKQNLVNLYKNQVVNITGTNYLTTAAIGANIIDTIYNSNGNTGIITSPLINDVIVISDVGVSSFITSSFFQSSNPYGKFQPLQYCPIGIASGIAGGIISANVEINPFIQKYVILQGDGGWLDGYGYLIDLANVIYDNSTISILYVILDDESYGNVANAEKALFGQTTIITNTTPIQQNISIPNIVNSIFSSVIVSTNTYLNVTNPSSLNTLVDNWYTTATPGLHLIYFNTAGATGSLISTNTCVS